MSPPTGRPVVEDHPSGYGYRYQWLTVFGHVELRYEYHLAQALYLGGLTVIRLRNPQEPMQRAA